MMHRHARRAGWLGVAVLVLLALVPALLRSG